MLGNHDVAATIAVSDIDRARRFYSETLGLSIEDDSMGELIVLKAGRAKLLVYRSAFAGTNKATSASFSVPEGIDEIVKALAAKGVVFEHYADMPDTRLEGDVHVSGDMRLAWFKDPDGNILNLVSG